MEIKLLHELPTELANKVCRFELEHFYTGEEDKTPERLAENKEKYFSQPKAWLLVFEGDQITGRTLLHRRKIEFDGKEVILGGVGGVCTHKEKRRRGIATMMLKEAMEILKKWGCGVAYLCTNPEKTGSLYSQVGFVPLKKPYTYYGRSGKLYKDDYGMIAPVNSTELFEKILHSQQKLHLGTGNW